MARIVTNTSANTVFKNYMKNNMALATSTERLATGLRINRGSDDPGGLGVSEQMRGRIKATGAAIDSLQNANSFINTVDGYLQNAHDILSRMMELAVKLGDGSLGATDKSNLYAEGSQLAAELSEIYAAQFSNDSAVTIGSTVTYVVDPSGNTMMIGIDTANLSVAYDDFAFDQGDVTQPIALIQQQISELATQRATLGSQQSRLTFKLSAQMNYLDNLSAAEGIIRNVDMAKESTSFTRNQILVQSSTAMLAQANAASQNVLSLLR